MSEHSIILPPEGWPPPWPLVLELLARPTATGWVLVGGLMTQVHAALAGLLPRRTTEDVDLLVDVLAERSSVMGVVGDLESIGFRPQEPGWRDGPFHRLCRNDDVVDVLVADHLPKHLNPRVIGHPMMAIDGGAQALDRLMSVSVIRSNVLLGELLIPDLLGALILKAAASVADNRDNARHVGDAALLAALITDHAAQRARADGTVCRG